MGGGCLPSYGHLLKFLARFSKVLFSEMFQGESIAYKMLYVSLVDKGCEVNVQSICHLSLIIVAVYIIALPFHFRCVIKYIDSNSINCACDTVCLKTVLLYIIKLI